MTAPPIRRRSPLSTAASCAICESSRASEVSLLRDEIKVALLRRGVIDDGRAPGVFHEGVAGDHAPVMRAVESGEAFVVIRNGTTIAVVRPASDEELSTGLPLAHAARRTDYRSWPRVESHVTSAEILADLRDER